MKIVLLDVLKTGVVEPQRTEAPSRVAMDEHGERKETAVRLAYATKLDVGYFVRSKVEDFLKFGSRTLASRTALGTRQAVSLPAEQMSYQCYVWRRPDGLCCVVVADQEYPQLAAWQVCCKAMADFDVRQGGKEDWKKATKDCDGGKQAPWLTNLIELSQDPTKIDKLLEVKQKLEEITVIMYENIEKVLERGERLDDLVAKTEDLDAAAKLFFKDTKKVNSCCHRYFG